MKRKIDSYINGEKVNGAVFVNHVTYGSGRKALFLCADCGEGVIKRFTNVRDRGQKYCKKCVGFRRGATKGYKHSLKYDFLPQLKKTTFNKLKCSAKLRNKCFNLSYDFVINEVSKNCKYCGCKPNQKRTRSGNVFFHHGLDRIDNDIDYVKSNVVSCCTICNRAKNNLNVSDFMNWIKNIKSQNA